MVVTRNELQVETKLKRKKIRIELGSASRNYSVVVLNSKISSFKTAENKIDHKAEKELL